MAANSQWGVSIIKSNLSYFIHFAQGRMDKSYQTSGEALEAANESGDIFSKAMASVCHGISCYGRGLFDKAILHLTEGYKFCDKIKLVIFQGLAHFFLGEAYFETQNFIDSADNYKRASEIFEQNRIIPSWKNVSRSAAIRMKALTKAPGVNLETVVTYANANKARIWDGWIYRNIGEIFLNTDEPAVAEIKKWINKAIKADSNNGTMLNLGRTYTLYAQLYKHIGEHSNAVHALKMAMGVFKNCGADGFLKQAEKNLASIA
jgi:tetratricopeptide (TPR) repeat protein